MSSFATSPSAQISVQRAVHTETTTVPTTARPRLSVIVVSFNCRDLLAACLDSLGRERRLISLEVIVIDNGSTDGTSDMVASRYAWVRFIDAGENIGFSKANNLGLAAASGEYILLLNPDTVVPERALLDATAALEARPTIGMLGCKLVRPDGTLDHAGKRGFPTPTSALYHFVGLSRLRPRSPRFAQYTAGHVDPHEEAIVDAVNGAFMLVRREALADVGGLDDDFWLYMEDLDWCYRFARAGWPVLYWPSVSVVHVKAGSSGQRRSWKANHAFHRGMWLFFRKHYAHESSRVTAAAVWSGIWLKLLASATRSWIVRRGRP